MFCFDSFKFFFLHGVLDENEICEHKDQNTSVIYRHSIIKNTFNNH